MSTDIAGWVEIKLNDNWFGTVKLLPIIRRNYKMFDFLFGGRSGNYDEAIAGNRGTPDDLSPEAQSGCETWIGWDELQAIDWSAYDDILTDDWKRLFKILETLAEWELCQDVRLVVHFF